MRNTNLMAGADHFEEFSANFERKETHYTVTQFNGNEILTQNETSTDCGFHALFNLKNAYNKDTPEEINLPSGDENKSYSRFKWDFKEKLQKEIGMNFESDLEEDMDVRGRHYFIQENHLDDHVFCLDTFDNLFIAPVRGTSKDPIIGIENMYSAAGREPLSARKTLNTIAENYSRNHWIYWLVNAPTMIQRKEHPHSILIAIHKENGEGKDVTVYVFDSLKKGRCQKDAYISQRGQRVPAGFVKNTFMPFFETFMKNYPKKFPVELPAPLPGAQLTEKLAALQTSMTQLKAKLATFSERLATLKTSLKPHSKTPSIINQLPRRT